MIRHREKCDNAVFTQIQAEICRDHRLHGGMLTLDESGDVRAGDKSAGAAQQYIGHVGKIEMGQVDVHRRAGKFSMALSR